MPNQKVFEGWVNVYKYDEGQDVFECCVFGHALQEQAQKQLDANTSTNKKCAVGGRPRRVRVEIID